MINLIREDVFLDFENHDEAPEEAIAVLRSFLTEDLDRMRRQMIPEGRDMPDGPLSPGAERFIVALHGELKKRGPMRQEDEKRNYPTSGDFGED